VVKFIKKVIGRDKLYIGGYPMYLCGSLQTTQPQKLTQYASSEGHTILYISIDRKLYIVPQYYL